MTQTASAPETDSATVPSVADLIDLHSAYGEPIEFDDADRNTYKQDTCQCGTPLGMHLSLEAHRAREVEAFVAAQVAESFRAVRSQLLLVADELALHDAPLHIQADPDQIIVEHCLRLGLKDPAVEEKVAALRAAVTDLGLPHGVSFFNRDGSANFIWQERNQRITVYIVHGEPFEVESVPNGPLTPFRSDDPDKAAQEVKKLMAAGSEA